MKVVKTTTTKNETSATIDIFDGRDLPRKVKNQVANDIGQYLVEQTLMDVSSSNSPVQGHGSFESLTSKEYKAKKKLEVGNTKANIELSGETLDQFDYKIQGDELKIGVFGKRAPVADGHNNLSGDSELPLRRFIPAEGENYKPSIQKEIDRIIADALAENEVVAKEDLEDISSKAALYSHLGRALGLTSRSEIRLAVFRNQDLLDLLRDEDLVELL